MAGTGRYTGNLNTGRAAQQPHPSPRKQTPYLMDKMELAPEPRTPEGLPRIRCPPPLPDPPEEWTEAAAWEFIGQLFGLYRDLRHHEDRTFVLIKILRAYISLRDTILQQPEHREMTMRMLQDIGRQIKVYQTIQDPDGLVQKFVFHLRQRILEMDNAQAGWF